jgi:hypothetical protein
MLVAITIKLSSVTNGSPLPAALESLHHVTDPDAAESRQNR